MTIKLGVLVTWKVGADPTQVDAFLRDVTMQLAAGPFLNVEHGVTLNPAASPDKLSPKGAVLADWGFVAELAEESDAQRWGASEAHRSMETNLQPVLGTMTVLSWRTAGDAEAGRRSL